LSDDGLWTRIRKGRLVQVLGVYLAASWVVLQVVGELRDSLELPAWIGPITFILLAVGLLVVLATGWVQSHPLVEAKAAADEVPRSWELDVAEIKASLKRGELPHLNWARAALGGVFAFSLLFGFAGLYIVIQDRGRSFEPPEALADAAPAIAVLPFTVRGEGLDVWREGMVETLSANLDGAAGLRAIDSRTVLARWGEKVGDDRNADLSVVMDVARATGARWALVGSAIQSGSGVRLSADIHDVATGEILGDGLAEGSPDSIFILVDELSIEVLRSLFADSGTDFSFDLARITTHSVPALRAYLEAEALFRRGEFEAAAPLYHQAIERDSTFGLAHYRLSEVYGWTASIAAPARREALQNALRLLDRLPAREALILRAKYAYGQGDMAMIDSIQGAVRRFPDDAEAWYLLGDSFLHSGWRLPSSLEQIEQTFERAVELDPNFAPYLIHWFDLALWWRPDSTKAAARLRRLEEAAPNAEHVLAKRIAFDLAFGDSATRTATLDSLPRVEPRTRIRVLSETLYHGRQAPQRAVVIRSLLESAPTDARGAGRRWLAETYSNGMGQVGRALAQIDSPDVPPVERACELWRMGEFGLPVDAARVRAALAPLPSDSTAAVCVQVARAANAVDEGRWAEHEALLAWLDERDLRLDRMVADSAQRARARVGLTATRRGLEGYAQWRRGELDRAIVSLREGVPGQSVTRWWLARALLEAGRTAEAVPWLRSFWWTQLSLAHYYLGSAYEELGDRERAIESYQYFVEAWFEADPGLQPLVEEARQSIARLRDAPAAGAGEGDGT